jgi:hypothetical protein
MCPKVSLGGDEKRGSCRGVTKWVGPKSGGPLNSVAKKRRSRMKIEIMKRSKSKIRSKRRTASAAAYS